MSESARQVSQEFWRPAQPPQTQYNELRAEAHCANCGTQLAPGARFCHVCGNEREADTRVRFKRGLLRVPDFEIIRQRIGLPVASTVLLVVAGICMLATVMTGFVYRADTMAEWQAVQTWRIEWMLAALVALVAAILFRKAPDSQ